MQKGISQNQYESLKVKLNQKLKPLIPIPLNQIEKKIDEIEKRLHQSTQEKPSL
jgi:hypothetical protein